VLALATQLGRLNHQQHVCETWPLPGQTAVPDDKTDAADAHHAHEAYHPEPDIALFQTRACQGNSRDRAVFQASLSPVPIELRGTTDAPSRDKSLSDPRQPAF
jgi:hypothetical protein